MANIVSNAQEVESQRAPKQLKKRITFGDGGSRQPVKAPSQDAEGQFFTTSCVYFPPPRPVSPSNHTTNTTLSSVQTQALPGPWLDLTHTSTSLVTPEAFIWSSKTRRVRMISYSADFGRTWSEIPSVCTCTLESQVEDSDPYHRLRLHFEKGHPSRSDR